SQKGGARARAPEGPTDNRLPPRRRTSPRKRRQALVASLGENIGWQPPQSSQADPGRWSRSRVVQRNGSWVVARVSLSPPPTRMHRNTRTAARRIDSFYQETGGREPGELDPTQDRDSDGRRDPDIRHDEDDLDREATHRSSAAGPSRRRPHSECQHGQQARSRGDVGQGTGEMLRLLHNDKPQQRCEGSNAETEQGTTVPLGDVRPAVPDAHAGQDGQDRQKKQLA